MAPLLQVLTLLVVQADPSQPPDALKIEAQVLAARRSLRSGVVELIAVRSNPAEPQQPAIKRGYELAFDGTIRKSVLNMTPQDQEASPGKDDAIYGYARTDKTYLSYSNLANLDNPSQPLIAAGIWRTGKVEYDFTIDARVLGLVVSPTGRLHNQPLEACVGRPDRVRSSVRKERYQEREVWLVEYERKDGAVTRLWIDPEQGFSLLRAEVTFKTKWGPCTDTIANTPAQWGTAKIWFPKEVIYNRNCGGRHVIHEVATVTKAELNQPVDPGEFGLAGLHPPAGTPIMEVPSPPEGAQVWDGRQAVPLQDPQDRGSAQRLHGSSSQAMMISLNLALLAALCFALYYRGLKRAS